MELRAEPAAWADVGLRVGRGCPPPSLRAGLIGHRQHSLGEGGASGGGDGGKGVGDDSVRWVRQEVHSETLLVARLRYELRPGSQLIWDRDSCRSLADL